MQPAPGIDEFPVHPASWYLFGELKALRRGPVSKNMLGTRLVAFITEQGRVAVMHARCAHLGADLGCGQIVGEEIRCPFHHWQYDTTGRCTAMPSGSPVPAFAKQRSFPVEVRHGFVFFFFGSEPLVPLPFFLDRNPDDFVPGRPFSFVGDCSWYMLAANGFDEQHFQAVHDRRLTRPPEVDFPAPYARRMTFHAEVTGESIFDRLLRRFVGRTVVVTITNFNGPFILVTGTFGRAQSYMLIATQPTAPLETLTEVIVFAQKRKPAWLRPLLEPISLFLRRLFTQGFLKDDTDRLAGMRYNQFGFIDDDRSMVDFFRWLVALPQSTAQKPTSPITAPQPALPRTGNAESNELAGFALHGDRNRITP